MTRAKVKLSLVDDVMKFAKLSQKLGLDVLLKHNSYVVDGTSLLGIMSLNLSEPVIVDVIGTEDERVSFFDMLRCEGINIETYQEGDNE